MLFRVASGDLERKFFCNNRKSAHTNTFYSHEVDMGIVFQRVHCCVRLYFFNAFSTAPCSLQDISSFPQHRLFSWPLPVNITTSPFWAKLMALFIASCLSGIFS